MVFSSNLVKSEHLNRLQNRTSLPSGRRDLIEASQKPWPKNKPLLSVIIPCFNYGKYINAALDSIFLQSFQDFEIIIVESGSTDGITPDIVKKIKHPKIQVFTRPRRHLVGDNRNFGINKAQGKYVCCLDADDTLNPMFLERALFLLECASYDMISTNYRLFGEKNCEVTLPSRPSFAQVIGGAALNIAVFSKKFWSKIGGYRDTGIKSQHIPEDWDFYLRAAGRGARIYNLQESLLNVRWHIDSLSRDPQNSGYAIQLQTLRKRHNKVLQYKNFENFVRRNESVVKVSSGTLNLINRQIPNRKFGILIIPPFSLTDIEIAMHLKQLKQMSNINSNNNIVIMCPGSIADLTSQISDCYTKLTTHVFSMSDVSSDHMLKTTLLDYLIESRQIKKFVVGSIVFNRENTANLFDLYDRL